MKNRHFKADSSKMLFKSCKLVEPTIDAEGTIKAYVSVYGVPDAYDEIVEFGAFAESIARKLPKIVWHHQWDNPIGPTTLAKEIPAGDPSLPESIRQYGGLYVEGRFTQGVKQADEARLLMKDGAIDEFSIGYFLEDAFENETDGFLHLKKINLVEWSPVLVGANSETILVDVKSGGKNEPDEKEVVDGAVKAIIDAKDEKIKRVAIKALTDALKFLETPDTQVNLKGRTPHRKVGGKQKISVKIFNRVVKAMLKVKKIH